MNLYKTINFPGGSKSKVNDAGDRVRDDISTLADIKTIEDWRAAHRAVLNTFQAILRTRTKNSKAVVAQRHKRRNTIVGKLLRFPKMQLSRMDDVAGCRIIFPSVKELKKFRSHIHKARFKHKRKNDPDKYNYILNPKKTGYRGIHDVYSYDVNSESGRHLKGLLVEIQYRTKVQHAWATAVEVIGFITESQPKFEEGDTRYQYAMALASEILARSFEEMKGPFPELCDSELILKFLDIDSELGLIKTFKGLNSAKTSVNDKKNSILIFSEDGNLEVKSYKDSTEALRALFELEKELVGCDIVLVKADSSEEIRYAFKNYFTDAKDFIKYIETGCEKLSHKHIIDKKTLEKAIEQNAAADPG
ncbi:RelA/SpoT domain-containing protein [Desulfobacter sp. UBA2225]|uniref:RelA/SpoT domain-containing protein n=1 Tax=Desulfobacter sp. UBA2225 TaxID=1961413 RepID=UPI00257CBC72|nr:RelA/SpoT domain-containing protein [Desulfobacter sp. UBA2225]